MGEHALGRLRQLASRHALIGDVRGLGLLIGVELLRNRTTLERATDEAERVMYAALERGLKFKITLGNLLTLTPPLTISRQELDQAIDILDASLATVS